MKLAGLLLTLTIFLTGPTAWPQETGEPPNSPSPERVLVRKGERAAFAGVLVTREYLAALVAEAERLEREAAAERDFCEREKRVVLAACRSEGEAGLEFERARVAACEAQRVSEIRVYEDALAECRAPPSWAPYAAAGVGLLLGGGICMGAVAAER